MRSSSSLRSRRDSAIRVRSHSKHSQGTTDALAFSRAGACSGTAGTREKRRRSSMTWTLSPIFRTCTRTTPTLMRTIVAEGCTALAWNSPPGSSRATDSARSRRTWRGTIWRHRSRLNAWPNRSWGSWHSIARPTERDGSRRAPAETAPFASNGDARNRLYDGPPTKTGGRPDDPEPPHRVGALTPIPIPDPLLQLNDATAVSNASAKTNVRRIKTDTSAEPAV